MENPMFSAWWTVETPLGVEEKCFTVGSVKLIKQRRAAGSAAVCLLSKRMVVVEAGIDFLNAYQN